jgi:hypothetical protein
MPDFRDTDIPIIESPTTEPHDALTNIVERRTWEEFRATGLLWAANNILHWFGWAIVVATDDAQPDKVIDVYPVRTKWRGFGKEADDRGIRRLSEWMASAGPALRKDIKD